MNASDVAKQKTELNRLCNLPTEGRAWYVIDLQWWNKLNSFIDAATSGDSLDVAYDDFPGKIDNTNLLKELKNILRKQLTLTDDVSIQLFVFEGDTYEELTNDGVTIGEASLERQNKLFFKVAKSNGVKPGAIGASDPSRPISTFSPGPPSGNSLFQHTPKSVREPGLCGLSNLGNTCFMNSAIQCMSNVPELTAYFHGDWQKEINRKNPLGTRGRIATAYAELIDHMWSGLYTSDVPRTLKREITLIANQFYGYAQHDSHELLVFLMDGLHEDLNRVLNKPYIETKDAGDRDDKVVADEAWVNYKARNDSIIVDLFHGQLKSTVVCPTCGYQSITFDPFASLNLPLPEVSKYYKSVYVWPWLHSGQQQTGPIRLEIPVAPVLFVRDLITSLEQFRPPHQHCQYYLTEVYNHNFGSPFHMDHHIRDIYGPPIFAYELPPGELIPVRLQQSNAHNISAWVGIPFYLSIPVGVETDVDATYLLECVASRLCAIGIGAEECCAARDSDTILERKTAADRQAHGTTSSTNTAILGSNNCATTVAMDQDNSNMVVNGAEENPMCQYLFDRVQLLDDQNQEIDMETVDFTRTDRSAFRMVIECTDSPLRLKLDESMRSISQTRHNLSQGNSSKSQITLDQCFKQFVSLEKLSARDLWYCKRCKNQKQATKKFDMWSLPNMLVIQLKRFRSSLRSRDKIDNLVDFPIRGLDLTEWVVNSTTPERYVYDLIAVSNHMGYLGGGHYTAYAINERTRQWYLFDDASVHEIDDSRVVTRAAYVLVYRRRLEHSQQPSSSLNLDYNPDDDLNDVE